MQLNSAAVRFAVVQESAVTSRCKQTFTSTVEKRFEDPDGALRDVVHQKVICLVMFPAVMFYPQWLAGSVELCKQGEVEGTRRGGGYLGSFGICFQQSPLLFTS